MIKFILVLLFGGTVPVTPEPITAVSTETIAIKPVSSIDGYGSLQLDVSSRIPASLGPFESWSRAIDVFPKNSIEATLSQSGGQSSIILHYSGESIFTKDGLRLILKPSTKIPSDARYDRLRISTTVPLEDVRVYWRNVGDK
jgi:hypothetical protein